MDINSTIKNDVENIYKLISNSIHGSEAFKPHTSFHMEMPKITRTYASGQTIPEIEDVIFNNPATIVFWNDGTKTVVKAQDDDVFDAEKGLAMAIAKKAFGNKGNYCEKLKPWLEEYEEQLDILGGKVSIKEACERACAAMKKMTQALNTDANLDVNNVECTYNRLKNIEQDTKATKKDLLCAIRDGINWLAEDINK